MGNEKKEDKFQIVDFLAGAFVATILTFGITASIFIPTIPEPIPVITIANVNSKNIIIMEIKGKKFYSTNPTNGDSWFKKDGIKINFSSRGIDGNELVTKYQKYLARNMIRDAESNKPKKEKK